LTTAMSPRIVKVVAPPPDCDFSGLWRVLGEAPAGQYLRLCQVASCSTTYIWAKPEQIADATRDEIQANRFARRARRAFWRSR
jgi:hypothetical protein